MTADRSRAAGPLTDVLVAGDVPATLAVGVVCGLAAVLTGWSVLVFRSGSPLKP
jgi:hypothetical protein